jgi:putative Mg2+ transporter-C (MgtC) family protein
MDTMPLTIDWPAIALRLACALVTGAVFGFDRSESGKAAGLRTTLLVCLAACVAMLQVNVLLTLTGKTPGSFAVLDLMRLPLGILTGMGFIGAGAVLRKDGLVTGVTTAATLWFVTVVGLCIGGGQFRLAGAATVLGLAVLWGLRFVERRLERQKSAWLCVTYDAELGSAAPIRVVEALRQLGCGCVSHGDGWNAQDGVREAKLLVHWREAYDMDAVSPRFVETARAAGASSARWTKIE